MTALNFTKMYHSCRSCGYFRRYCRNLFIIASIRIDHSTILLKSHLPFQKMVS